MLVQALVAVAIAQTPIVLEPKVTSAIVLKNGVTLLVREVDLPAGKGSFRIEKIPAAYDGTFWYGTNASKLSDLTTSLKYIKKTISRKTGGFVELLTANIGKPLTLKVSRENAEETFSGTLEEFNGSTIILRNGDNLRMVSLMSIVELNTSTLTTKELSAEVDWPQLSISFTADAPAPDKLRLMTIETGALWVGTYLIDIGKERATVDGKAQLGLGNLEFDNVDVKLLAGDPHLKFSRRYDLATGIGSAKDYLNGSQSIYKELSTNPLDPYDRLGEVIRYAATVLNASYTGYLGGLGGGGFGGQGQIGYDPTDNSIIVRESDAFNAQTGNTTAANASEDVYFYNLGKLSVAPGERITRPLFHVTSAYELVNTWGESAPTVRKQLRLNNDTNLPFTPGSVMVLRNGELMAMTAMPFAAPTQKVNIELGAVLDLRVAAETILVDTRSAGNRNIALMIHTMRKTFVLENPRDEEVTFEITAEVDGHIVDAGGAKVTAVDKYFSRPPYFRQRLVWTAKVAPRSVRELRAVYETTSTGPRLEP